MTKDELIDLLADKEHASWARWMDYLFSRCERHSDGSVTIPAHLATHWRRQVDTGYQALTDTEKQSDRNEVAHILPIIDEYTRVENVAAFIVILTKAAKEFSESRTPLQGETDKLTSV